MTVAMVVLHCVKQQQARLFGCVGESDAIGYTFVVIILERYLLIHNVTITDGCWVVILLLLALAGDTNY
jgi:hypothetical protein